jgi:Holliday junction resolvase RusA-like endonuclease
MLKVETVAIHFTVPLTPISKKNSQQILVNKATGRPFIMPSKKYKEYEQNALWFIPKGETINKPVNVKCLFYMPTRRKCDLVNMQEAILDVMVKAGLLKDDNYSIVQSMDGSRVLYDKSNPRTEVYITEVKEDATH